MGTLSGKSSASKNCFAAELSFAHSQHLTISLSRLQDEANRVLTQLTISPRNELNFKHYIDNAGLLSHISGLVTFIIEIGYFLDTQ